MPERDREQQVSTKPVIELHQRDVGHEILHPWLLGEQCRARGRQPAIHQRPGVEGEPGIEARDKPAKRDLDEKQHEHELRAVGHPAGVPCHGRGVEPRPHPDDEREDDAGERQMQGELDRRHRHHALLQAGMDHDPADRALKPAKSADGGELPEQRAAHCSLPGEPEQRQEPGDADEAPELAVAPLPPVDELEFGEAHAPIEELVLWDLTVFLELGQPARFRQRRDRAHQGPPLGDGEAGIGQPRRAAHQHHREDEASHPREPEADGGQAGGGRAGARIEKGRGHMGHVIPLPPWLNA